MKSSTTPTISNSELFQTLIFLPIGFFIHSRGELQEMLGLSDRENFRQKYLQPAIEAGLIALTIPDKPTSRNQKYYLTEKGEQYKNSLE